MKRPMSVLFRNMTSQELVKYRPFVKSMSRETLEELTLALVARIEFDLAMFDEAIALCADILEDRENVQLRYRSNS